MISKVNWNKVNLWSSHKSWAALEAGTFGNVVASNRVGKTFGMDIHMSFSEVLKRGFGLKEEKYVMHLPPVPQSTPDPGNQDLCLSLHNKPSNSTMKIRMDILRGNSHL